MDRTVWQEPQRAGATDRFVADPHDLDMIGVRIAEPPGSFPENFRWSHDVERLHALRRQNDDLHGEKPSYPDRQCKWETGWSNNASLKVIAQA
jgi:hypothetical protein